MKRAFLVDYFYKELARGWVIDEQKREMERENEGG